MNGYNHDYILQIVDLLVKIIGGAIGLILFFIGFKRYKKEQTWKRKEFVAKEIKELHQDKISVNAMLMLDWSYRTIELFSEHPDYEKRSVLVDRKTLEKALIPHRKRKKNFTKEEIAIRDTFDHFFINLTKFEHFIQAGMVSYEDFFPYLHYWIDLIALNLPGRTKSVLHHYLLTYEYSGVINLINRFGKDIKPIPQIDEIIDEIQTD